MTFEALQQNLKHIAEIIREMYIFTNQLDIIQNLETNNQSSINVKEKMLLINSISALRNQLKILNNSTPGLLGGVGLYKKLPSDTLGQSVAKPVQTKKFVKLKYQPKPEEEQVSLTIDNKDRLIFLENLSKSNLSINKLKKKYAVEKTSGIFGKPSSYAKLANKFFRNFSNSLIAKGHFNKLNRNLRKMNSRFIVGTYVSMIFLTILISFFISIFVFILLLFFKVSLLFPFLSVAGESILLRIVKVFWVLFVIPLGAGFLMYIYPVTEGKSLGAKIDQELPFVAIHMSAIATSGIEPVNIFKIILKNKEYKYSNIEFKKLMNLINFHGLDVISALKRISRSCPSPKLKGLLDGFATAMTSGGDLHIFLDKHAESLLFEYRLEREKYTKTSETFMDIYISIAIAAPMILLLLFVVMGSTGTLTSFMGLGVKTLGFLVILAIVFLNLLFIMFLKLKQPKL